MSVEWTGLHRLFSAAITYGKNVGPTKETTCQWSGQGCIVSLSAAITSSRCATRSTFPVIGSSCFHQSSPASAWSSVAVLAYSRSRDYP